MYEGVALIVEGTETGNCFGRVGAEYLGKAFDDAHENICLGDARGLMPEIYCETGVGNVEASGVRAG